MLVDSHCHLDFPDFADELDAVVERAREAGIGRLLTICTSLTRLEKNLEIADRYDEIFCAAGIHPHEAAQEGDVTRARLVGMAADRQSVVEGTRGSVCVAVGGRAIM